MPGNNEESKRGVHTGAEGVFCVRGLVLARSSPGRFSHDDGICRVGVKRIKSAVIARGVGLGPVRYSLEPVSSRLPSI